MRTFLPLSFDLDGLGSSVIDRLVGRGLKVTIDTRRIGGIPDALVDEADGTRCDAAIGFIAFGCR